jgi:hypothetical protein
VVTFSDLLSLRCTFFLVVVRLNLLVDLVYIHRSLVYKYPVGELLRTSEVLVQNLKFVVMNIMVYEVEQPPGTSWKYCIACSRCKKSCDRD